MFKTYEMELAGRKIVVETGKMAGLASGSCLVRYGQTAVLVNVTVSDKQRDGIDFFPLNVDYEEKLYAVGRIPGSFNRREGKQAEKAILVSRAIDRLMRPLFPKDFRNDVCILCTVLSVEPDNSPEVAAMIGASIAVSISQIPFKGPTAGLNVGYVDNEIVINPTLEQRQKTRLNLTVAGTYEKVCMIEAGADQIPDDIMVEAIEKGHEEIRKVVKFIESIQADIGKRKMEYEHFNINQDVYDDVYNYAKEKMYSAVQSVDKTIRDNNLEVLKTEVEEYFKDKYGEEYDEKEIHILDALHTIEKKTVRKLIYEEHKRPDGRGIDDIRTLSAEVGLFERVHGSALFSRGQTQVLSIATLAPLSEVQELDGLDEQTSRRYMHHYNFPAYSTGETRPSKGPGRREIGHGALAQRALEAVIPSEEEFPYAIRVVSEVLSSNGSTSQGSVCASTLALMDAGVPIKEPVAGISTGLITSEDNPKEHLMIVDIQGIEDFYGDMDFKVAGTKNGITAIQVDIKIDGLTIEIIKEAFEKTKKARLHILDNVMLKALDKPRSNISKYAPKIASIKINPDKIKDVIGTGGKTINKIIEETNVKIDIDDDGNVSVCGVEELMIQRAIAIIEGIAKDIEVGDIYTGKVIKIMNFGAFVEILPGKDGLIHVSKLVNEEKRRVEDVVKIGDEILVQVTGIDHQGRINLSKMGNVEE